MIAPARVAAYDILVAVSSGRADLPSAIAHSRDVLRDDRDRSLAAEIGTGVQRWRAALDHVIATLARRPTDRLDPEVLEILRLGTYQLLHLSRVPASAVVDDAVKLTGKVGKRSASGFVNAVLRNVSRTRHALPLPPRPTDPSNRDDALDYLSITTSHPRWLAARWFDRMGLARAEAWTTFNNQPAPMMLRANPLRTTVLELRARLALEGVVAHLGRFAPDALAVEEGQPLRTAAAEEGEFVVQDEASQLVALLLGPAPVVPVLDTCAAPGGKATAIAATIRGRGWLVACDVRDRRIALLRQTLRATGTSNAWVVQADMAAGLPFRGAFGSVLVDAPCSGLGTLRRDPDIRWRRREADLAVLARAQAHLLRHAAHAVAPGGRLVYATCSTEPEENEAIVREFLRTADGFVPVDARRVHPSLPPDVVDGHGHLRTSPDRHGLEGFFGAVFERLRQL